MFPCKHEYIERQSKKIITENLYYDKLIYLIYGPIRENSHYLFKLLTSNYFSSFLAFLNYDLKLRPGTISQKKFFARYNIDPNECFDDLKTLTSARKIFERKITYWINRPMPDENTLIVSPADSRIIIGSLSEHKTFFIKDKFFNFEDLIGNRMNWQNKFDTGDFAIFRLTPDKYHYNHTPVSGQVVDFYEINGRYHSCNPEAIIREVTPFSKNKRTVTIINTDVEGGTNVGYVAMIEIVALMIGEIVQTYSSFQYNNPQPIKTGMFVKRGCPKSLYKPGSSTTILFFESNRIEFDCDLIENSKNALVKNRFKNIFYNCGIETDINAREGIGRKI